VRREERRDGEREGRRREGAGEEEGRRDTHTVLEYTIRDALDPFFGGGERRDGGERRGGETGKNDGEKRQGE
jgi:hypothetical protein